MDNEVENNGIEVVAEEQKKQKKIKEVKKKIIVLIKALLKKDRAVIDKAFDDLKNDGVHVELEEEYGSHFKLYVSCSIFSVNFELSYGKDYLPF